MTAQLKISRRHLLRVSAAALGAAPWIVPRTAFGANDRIIMGCIGTGGQGRGDMSGFLGFPEVKVVIVCDVVADHRNLAKAIVDERYGNKDCAVTHDFREVLGRSDIDAVLIATPDHWHAIIATEAMKNGKDVYCEKPETLTVRQGRVMTEIARRYGRVFSGGSQRVWEDYNWYHRMMWSGAAGELKEVFVGIGGPSGEMLLPAQPVPEWLDWDMWLGPAPWRPYNKGYHPANWRGCRDFSGGGMTDWGAHHIGGAMFAAQLHDKPLPVEVIPPGKDNPQLTYKYASGVQMHLGGTWGDGPLSFKGTLGEVPDRKKPRTAPPAISIPNYKGRGIFGDFLHCVKTRQRPFRDIEIAHRTVATCHLANIAFWSGRAFKFDPVKEEIVGDDELNRWIDRPRRAPWVL